MAKVNEDEITRRLLLAVNNRNTLLEAEHKTSFRLFNGFYEGIAEIVVDIYGRTIVIFSHADNEEDSIYLTQTTRDALLEALPWIKCVVVKHHGADEPQLRKGVITFGSHPDQLIFEHGVGYAVDLLLNQDASFYLDTRNLRKWILDHTDGLEVLNTFAYTGSLGVAALAGGASQVFQTDRNRKYLELAHRSAMHNHLDLGKMKLAAVDFFVAMGQLKRSERLFDLAIIDPPFFSTSENGVVDQMRESDRLINKIRPLVKDDGRIIAINNALFLEGREYMRSLENLTRGGFVEIEEIIPVPEDITGYANSIISKPPVDPSPFIHPTKIVLLKIKHKN